MTTLGFLRAAAVGAVAIGAALPLGAGATSVAATVPPQSYVVDDDRRQCPEATFNTITSAVDAAPPASLIQVCPGTYRESVTVRKPLTVRGDTRAVDAIDCLNPVLPALAPETYPILDLGLGAGPAFTLEADRVALSGFVIRGGIPVAVQTSDEYSGYRVHHNLFANNRLGVWIASGRAGTSPAESRVDHNCFHRNTWGVSNGDIVNGVLAIHVLRNARVDHNEVFGLASGDGTGLTERAFEAFDTKDVLFDHNTARGGDNTFLLSGSDRTSVVDNVLDRVNVGMEIGRLQPSKSLEITGNRFIGTGGTAIGFNRTPSGALNSGVLVRGNEIRGWGTGIALGGAPNLPVGTLEDSEITRNVISVRQNAIRFRALNTRIYVHHNVLNDNGFHGIHAICGEYVDPLTQTTNLGCPTENRFVANEMLRNGWNTTSTAPGPYYDARDDSGVVGVLRNTWLDNRCASDLPTGLLCDLP
jgi:hypothetical protein